MSMPGRRVSTARRDPHPYAFYTENVTLPVLYIDIILLLLEMDTKTSFFCLKITHALELSPDQALCSSAASYWHPACRPAVYALGLSPNQTPYRDTIFIKLLTGISQDSTFSVNQVYFR